MLTDHCTYDLIILDDHCICDYILQIKYPEYLNMLGDHCNCMHDYILNI